MITDLYKLCECKYSPTSFNWPCWDQYPCGYAVWFDQFYIGRVIHVLTDSLLCMITYKNCFVLTVERKCMFKKQLPFLH